MNKTPLRIFGLVVLVVAVIALVAFIDAGSDEAATVPVQAADSEAQGIFQVNCGTCHTLAAGGTDGVVGPNLDQILPINPTGATGTAQQVEEANRNGWESEYGRVLNAITCGLGGRMPKGILQGEQAQEVAGFVAAYAGQLGPDQGPLLPAGERKLSPAQPCAGEPGSAATPGPAQAGGGSQGAGSGQGQGSS
jgi:mono/diheme cytochrome c family protein